MSIYRGSRSSLHYDPYENLLCLISGTKKVVLYSAGLMPFLYPRPITDESSNHSRVNFACPDQLKHPLFKEAAIQEVEFILKVSLGLTGKYFNQKGIAYSFLLLCV
jgi:hypothetical protein